MAYQLTIQFSYTDIDGINTTRSLGNIVGSAMVLTGFVQIPAGSPAGTEFDVNLGAFLQGAQAAVLENKTGQELRTAWQGNFSYNIVNGGWTAFGGPSIPQNGAVSNYRFFLTKDQVGPGLIVFHALGQ